MGEALMVLAEVSESQWGMVTTAQANERGVSHMTLKRLTESGGLVRLAHGVYRDAGAPGGEYDELRSAWLAAEPARLAWDRLRDKPGKVVVSGESAAGLHGMGNFRAMRSEFTTPYRRQSQRPEVHYRTRTLASDDVTVREGLPVTTPERTIADLVEQRAQLDHVGDALRDAARKSQLDTERLSELLSPLAERNGQPKGNGSALLEELLEAAHIDLQSLSRQIVQMPDLGALVARDYLATIDASTLFDSPALRSALEAQSHQMAELAETLSKVVTPALPTFDKLAESLALATATFDTPAIRSLLEAQEKQLAAISAAVSKLAMPKMIGLENIQKAIESVGAASSVLGVGSAHKRIGEAVSTADWATLAQDAKYATSLESDKVER